jgi:hypothetical protein
MVGNVATPTSVSMLWLWVIGVVILGIIIAYGLMRAGRLGRGERERLDHNTVATQTHEDALKRRDAGRG